jgi:arylsulfatase A-like enzyme
VNNTSAIVLVLDRLGAGYVGPYGNTWIDTPSLNRLASQSLLVEHAWIDSPCLERLYDSYWHGSHAMAGHQARARTSLAALLRRSGIGTALVTDEPAVARHCSTAEFDQCVLAEDSAPPDTARNVNETHLARLLASAIECLSAMRAPLLVWIHARALSGPWDAPYELRRQFAQEDDPAPPEFVEVPSRRLAHDYDPDELLGVVHAYAGQVSALDRCLGAFVDALDSVLRLQDALLTVTSSRGFPLGEHLGIGQADEALYSELLQVPCITRFPDRVGATLRFQTLWQPYHLYATLVDWFGCNQSANPAASVCSLARAQRDWLASCAGTVGACERALRTPAWFLRVPSPNSSDKPNGQDQHRSARNDPTTWELFVKPDDRWDVNNVADRCPGILEKMADLLLVFQQAAEAGILDRSLEVPQELLERAD